MSKQEKPQDSEGENARFVPPHFDYLLTTKECAAWLKDISPVTLGKLVNSGDIPAIQLNRKVRLYHARSVMLALGADPGCVFSPHANNFLDSMISTDELADWFQLRVKRVYPLVHNKKIHAMGAS
jgi:hypothetical protein